MIETNLVKEIFYSAIDAFNNNFGTDFTIDKYLLDKQLETLKLFLERSLITQEQYDYKLQVLTTKIKIDE